MKEQIMQIIKRHNAVVYALNKCDLPVPANRLFPAMEIWDKLSSEGAAITDMARKHGIDVKCDMQSGEIIMACNIEIPGGH